MLNFVCRVKEGSLEVVRLATEGVSGNSWGEGESRLREQLQNVQTAKRRESGGCRAERGRAGRARRTGRDTHPALLHLG